MEASISSTKHSRKHVNRVRRSSEESIESLYGIMKQERQETTAGTSKTKSPEATHSGENVISTDDSLPSTEKTILYDNSLYCEQKEKMRRKLQFFFMNPIEKWQARRKFPYKFIVQVKS